MDIVELALFAAVGVAATYGGENFAEALDPFSNQVWFVAILLVIGAWALGLGFG